MSQNTQKPKLLAVVGPTASGKSSLSVVLARKFGGEIISADSRQFYIGNEIGADTVRGERQVVDGDEIVVCEGVPHHLVSFRKIDDPVSLAEFKVLATRLAKAIVARGKLPILCGGTGLYVSAVTDNYLLPEAEPDPEWREGMGKRDTADLFRELREGDPEYANRISPNNRRYIIRALEVMSVTGRPFSRAQAKGEPVFSVLKIGISRPRPELYARIDQRVDEMVKAGLLEETRRLAGKYGWELPAMSGLGHRQMGMHLRGEADLPEAVRLIKRDTRHYARRQLIWWRRDPDVRWVSGQEEAVSLVEGFLVG
ncbi:tRNA (adenosine(37)-N6)-dimethylallyltransferase MiaA [Candidatus Uhrbacteria bacterium]|nr:tRNA (adenosine(37)-N6)-dimethylallyltransferase MiaA [Candidatus Uhrbacteria bacterium]